MTVMERLLDEVSFVGAELEDKRVVIDEAYVRARLDEVTGDTDLSRYIL
jgi:ATP-dependent HslUV protease ATP-binding subunit HslU